LGTNNGIEQAFDLFDLWVATPNQKRRRTGKRKDQEPLSEETPKKRRSSRLKFTPITLPGTPDQLKQKLPKDEKKLTKREKRLSAPLTPHRTDTAMPRASSSNDALLTPVRKEEEIKCKVQPVSMLVSTMWASDLKYP